MKILLTEQDEFFKTWREKHSGIKDGFFERSQFLRKQLDAMVKEYDDLSDQSWDAVKKFLMENKGLKATEIENLSLIDGALVSLSDQEAFLKMVQNKTGMLSGIL